MSDNLIDPEIIYQFPKPGTVYKEYGDSICAVTEDIDLQILYSAYMQGVFPWFCEDEGEPVVWHSTDPRFVLMPQDFHIPKSAAKFLKHTPYTYTMDKAFRQVMVQCAMQNREGQNGTWIGDMMLEAYVKFHEEGYAHSFEVWHDDELVGGFYGVLIGSVFCGESMFTKESDSSKSAFILFMKAFIECGGIIVDSQSYTDNIARYGAKNISRSAFLRIEREALHTPLKKDLAVEFEIQCDRLGEI
ncbi:MAG: leucyl/phenylalanyl-tRNA--protein transferase [Treponema sp.]|nr:leucyl/phenylalanyl-tRNA--protein transferase [Candidatus Treponema equi]